MPSNDKNARSELYKIYVRTSAVGLEVVLSIALGTGLGWWLDTWLQMRWLWLVGLLFGALAAAKRLYAFAKEQMQNQEEPQDKN